MSLRKRLNKGGNGEVKDTRWESFGTQLGPPKEV